MVEFTRVKWSLEGVTMDSPDADTYPDLFDVVGTVTFTPEVPAGTWQHKPTQSIVHIETRTAEIQGGKLTYAGEEGIWLEASVDRVAYPVAWRWRATFDLYADDRQIPLRPLDFVTEPDTEVELSDMFHQTRTPAEFDPVSLGYVWTGTSEPPIKKEGVMWLKANGDLMYWRAD